MPDPIVLAGATGDLGGRIAKALAALGAPTRAIVRPGSSGEKLRPLQALGVQVVEADYADPTALRRACEGASCVLSALSGLSPVIVDAQGRLLEAAVAAGAPRFIPSDFAIDFTKLPEGSNRNLDLRKRFKAEHADKAERSIRITSILNGAFADMLTGTIPIIRHEIRRVLYWSHADQPMDFTTIDDTAAFTAHAALDPDSPRKLNIAGDRISVRGLAEVMSEISGRRYKPLAAGTIGTLKLTIGVAKALAPKDSEDLYPAWQGMQYMRNMFSGEGALDTPLDNARYPNLRWTTAKDVLARAWRERAAA